MSCLKKYQQLPIYQKAELLRRLVESLCATLPEDDQYIQDTKHFMLEDAMVILSKIVGAEAGNLYSIRMQNAALIRECAMNLFVQVGSLRFHESYKDIEYVMLIRKELEEFRLLFIDWVDGFDRSNYIWDEWGLFNPEGAIEPDDFRLPGSDDDFDIEGFLGEED